MTDPVIVALDVGGTGIKGALVRPDGEVHHTQRRPTHAERGPVAVIDAILDFTEGLAAHARSDDRDPVAVGLAVPGVVDEANGVAVWSANLGFRDVPLRDLVSARLGLPTVLGHDVRAAGVAEARMGLPTVLGHDLGDAGVAEVRLGTGRGPAHVLFVAIGTGIAAALVVRGAAYSGAHGAAGELGHLVIRPGGTPCGCGGSGCLEAEASARAIGQRYADRSGISGATALDVVARAAQGETVAATVWREAIEALADGLVAAQALYDVDVLVLGGGLAEAGDALLEPLRDAVQQRITFHRMPAIIRAVLGTDAGCVGAALLARELLG